MQHPLGEKDFKMYNLAVSNLYCLSSLHQHNMKGDKTG